MQRAGGESGIQGAFMEKNAVLNMHENYGWGMPLNITSEFLKLFSYNTFK